MYGWIAIQPFTLKFKCKCKWKLRDTECTTIGGSVSTNYKSSNRIELSWLSQVLFYFIMIWHEPTHQPNYTPTHRWGSLHNFQIFKQNRIISIHSRLSFTAQWKSKSSVLTVWFAEKSSPACHLLLLCTGKLIVIFLF